jgi:hypothetical protein
MADTTYPKPSSNAGGGVDFEAQLWAAEAAIGRAAATDILNEPLYNLKNPQQSRENQ